MFSKKIDENQIREFDDKLNKRYGVSKEALKDMPLSKIKSISNINKTALREAKKFKIFRDISNTIIKGASAGAGVSGTINTIFPNAVPVIASAINTNSNLTIFGKSFNYVLAASKPVDQISGYVIIAIGAGIGAIIYSGYSLVRCSTKKIIAVHDRSKARKLCKKIHV